MVAASIPMSRSIVIQLPCRPKVTTRDSGSCSIAHPILAPVCVDFACCSFIVHSSEYVASPQKESRMRMMQLGRNGPQVSSVGLGCMGMAGGYGPADDAESIATVHAALDAGINFIDAADFYAAGQTELVLREALKGGRRQRAFIAIKYGAMRDPNGKGLGDDARPSATKNFLAYTLKRLGTDYVDLYQPSRIDPHVPIEDTVGAIADMVKAGYVRHIGLSEASAATVRRAHKVHPIAALQIEYSLFTRIVENDILPAMRELGIPIVAYGVLAGGLISDRAQASQSVGEIRSRKPRFFAENFARNHAMVQALGKIAREKGCSTAQLAIAWVRSRGNDIVPLIGARRRDQLKEGLGALDIALTVADLARIEQAVPPDAVAGTRYLPAAMAHLDSEH
jgi:aryl-alcohol dehydrogenase-like predicted oxidoreductase